MPKKFIVLSCFENQTFIFLEQNIFSQITKWYQCFLLQGILVYFIASLLEMSDWGGTDAESLEKGITHIFSDAGSIPLEVEDFKMKLVCCTSDGASVWSENRSNDNIVSSTAMDDQNSLCQPSR